MERKTYTQTQLRENIYQAVRESKIAPVGVKYYNSIVAWVVSDDFYSSVRETEKMVESLNISKEVTNIISKLLDYAQQKKMSSDFAFWCIRNYSDLVDIVESKILELRESNVPASEMKIAVLYLDIKNRITNE